MSKSPTKSMTRIMQEKPAKAMAGTKAKRHEKRRTNRGGPRRACKYHEASTARASIRLTGRKQGRMLPRRAPQHKSATRRP